VTGSSCKLTPRRKWWVHRNTSSGLCFSISNRFLFLLKLVGGNSGEFYSKLSSPDLLEGSKVGLDSVEEMKSSQHLREKASCSSNIQARIHSPSSYLQYFWASDPSRDSLRPEKHLRRFVSSQRKSFDEVVSCVTSCSCTRRCYHSSSSR